MKVSVEEIPTVPVNQKGILIRIRDDSGQNRSFEETYPGSDLQWQDVSAKIEAGVLSDRTIEGVDAAVEIEAFKSYVEEVASTAHEPPNDL